MDSNLPRCSKFIGIVKIIKKIIDYIKHESLTHFWQTFLFYKNICQKNVKKNYVLTKNNLKILNFSWQWVIIKTGKIIFILYYLYYLAIKEDENFFLVNTIWWSIQPFTGNLHDFHVITCSKLTIETLEQGVKYIQS